MYEISAHIIFSYTNDDTSGSHFNNLWQTDKGRSENITHKHLPFYTNVLIRIAV